MINSTSFVYSNLQVRSKTSQSANPINNDKVSLPSERNYLDIDSNKLHYLADAHTLKTLES